MSRTISMGHSSRSSSSISVSSGRRFLANSFRDFTLSFSVFWASISSSSLCGHAAGFTNFVGQFRKEFQNVVDNSNVGDLKDGRLRIFVDGNEKRISFNAGQMLERSADSASQVDLRLYGFSRRSDLARFRHPLRVNHRTRATDGGAQGLGQFLGNDHVLFLLNTPANGNENAVLGDIYIAGFGSNRLDIPAPRGQSTCGGGFVDDRS